VTDIHLSSNVLNEWQANSDMRYIYILSVVAALILLVSAINYINLWIARSEQRTKEIGIRQAIGGTKVNVALQLTIESLTQVVLALILSVIMVGSAIPVIQQWLGESISFSSSSRTTTWVYIFIGMIVFMMLVMLYPAKVISKIRPAIAIKGRPVSRGGVSIWEGLIAFQVLVTACLITATLAIDRQVSFIEAQPLGYDADHLVTIAQVSNVNVRERLKDALLQNPHIRSASGVSHLLVGTIYQSGYEISNRGKNEQVLWQRIHTDFDFCKTYQIPIVAGRDFSKDMASDSRSYIINETAAKALGYANAEGAVGLDVNDGGPVRGRIIGVMKDFHFKTLHTAIEPLIIHVVPDRIRMLTVNVANADMNSTIK